MMSITADLSQNITLITGNLRFYLDTIHLGEMFCEILEYQATKLFRKMEQNTNYFILSLPGSYAFDLYMYSGNVEEQNKVIWTFMSLQVMRHSQRWLIS